MYIYIYICIILHYLQMSYIILDLDIVLLYVPILSYIMLYNPMEFYGIQCIYCNYLTKEVTMMVHRMYPHVAVMICHQDIP